MRVVGIIFVLTASAAMQLPWFSCHSDCQDEVLPVWDLGVHHCHDERATDHHDHHCLAHCGRHGTTAGPEGGDGPDPKRDPGPGDHDLQLQLCRRPAPEKALAADAAPVACAAPWPTALDALTPIAYGDHRTHERFDTGPPDRLASVRLLL